MVEPCLMASRGCPPGLGAVFHPEQAPIRAPEGFPYFLPINGLNQEVVNSLSLSTRLQQKDELRLTTGLLDSNLHVLDSTPKSPALIDFQDSDPDSVRLSIGIAERCALQDKIMKLLASGSIEEQDILDLSKFHHLMGPQSRNMDLFQPDLLYPSSELCLYEPYFGIPGDRKTCPEKVQPQYNTATAMSDIVSVLTEFHSMKNSNKSSKQTMLVPYFERRRRPRTKTDASKPVTESIGSSKSQDKVKEKAPSKKKASTKTIKERDIFGNSNLHACESLLSVIVGRNQTGKSAIISLKKSGPQLPLFLTQCSATIAGTGIAVVLSVLCRVGSGMMPFSMSKLLTAGLGLGLVWLSGAVNKLRNTVVSINKASSKLGEKEEEMMTHLNKNLKDIYFRAATLMVLAAMRVA